MGGTRAYYASLLEQKLKDLNKSKVDAQGQLTVISEQEFADAIAAVKKDLDRQGPKKKQLKDFFRKFCGEQKGRSEEAKKFAHDDKSKALYGPGSRYDQYKKNRDELLKSSAQDVKQTIAWNHVKKRLNLKGAGGQPLKDDGLRWRPFLVRTDGSYESEKHNDELYELLALGQKRITKEQFIELRTKYYTKHPTEVQDNRKPAAQAVWESERVGDRILEMVKESLERTKEDRKKVASYATMILNGKAGQEGYPSLEECHRVVDNQEQLVAWDMQRMVSDLKEFGGLSDPKGTEKLMRSIQAEAGKGGADIQAAELASNYYFTIIDPFKIIDKVSPTTMDPPAEGKESMDGKLREAFLNGCMTQFGEIINTISAIDTKFGLRDGDPMIEYADKNPPMRVFRHEATDEQGNKSMRTAIVRLPRLTDAGGPVAITAAQPQELVNDGFEASVKGFVDICKDWNRKKHTSPQFEAMRDALEALQDRKLERDPTVHEIEAFQKKLQALLDTSQRYYDHKVEERHGEHFKRGFETTRVKFSKQLHEFAKQKLQELQYVKEHMETLELADKEERNLKNNPEYQALRKNGYKGNSLTYLRQKEEDRRLEERHRREEEERQRRLEELRQKELKKAEERKELYGRITSLRESCGNASKSNTSANEKIRQYIDDVKNQRDTLTTPEQKLNQVYHLCAARAIERMLKDEKTMREKDSQADTPIHQLVNGRKIKELTEMIIPDARFKRSIKDKQGHKEQNYDRMTADNEYPYRVSVWFLGDLKKAKEELEQEEPKLEEPKVEAPKKENPKLEAPNLEEPKAEAPKKEEPKAEAPKKENPKKEDPKAEDPKKEAPKKEDSKKEEPAKKQVDPSSQRSLVPGGVKGLQKEVDPMHAEPKILRQKPIEKNMVKNPLSLDKK